MNDRISEYSVYAIVHMDELKRVHKEGGTGSFMEGKSWAGAAKLLQDAKVAGRHMAVIFADAANIDKLLYYAFLTEIDVMDARQTRYVFENLTPIGQIIPKTALLKKSDRKPLSVDFIRSYCIVVTPDFVSMPKNKSRETEREPTPVKSRQGRPPIYLFGYSGKTDEVIEQAIGENGLLLDIRFSPKSRRAGYSRAGLIRTFGDRYHHVREFGNADYQTGGIRLADPDAGLAIIDALAAEHPGPIFLMCACEDGTTCHRHEVGRLLKNRGYSVKEYVF